MSCALIATAGCSLAGCVKRYEPPDANEPHALVKLRRVFHSVPGEERASYANVNGKRVFLRDESAALDAPQTDALRVHPGPTRWELGVEFHHQESRTVQETYYEQVPYRTTEVYTEYQSYRCGTGTCQRPTTRTRNVTRYRSQPRQRWVNKIERVVDDRCKAGLYGNFADGEVYLLQYTYVGEGRCSVQCLKQTRGAPGQGASTVPCAR